MSAQSVGTYAISTVFWTKVAGMKVAAPLTQQVIWRTSFKGYDSHLHSHQGDRALDLEVGVGEYLTTMQFPIEILYRLHHVPYLSPLIPPTNPGGSWRRQLGSL